MVRLTVSLTLNGATGLTTGTINGYGTLNLNGANNTIGALSGGGELDVQGATQLTAGGTIGTLKIGAAIDLREGLTVTTMGGGAGSIEVAADKTLTVNGWTTENATLTGLTLNGGATLDLKAMTSGTADIGTLTGAELSEEKKATVKIGNVFAGDNNLVLKIGSLSGFDSVKLQLDVSALELSEPESSNEYQLFSDSIEDLLGSIELTGLTGFAPDGHHVLRLTAAGVLEYNVSDGTLVWDKDETDGTWEASDSKDWKGGFTFANGEDSASFGGEGLTDSSATVTLSGEVKAVNVQITSGGYTFEMNAAEGGSPSSLTVSGVLELGADTDTTFKATVNVSGAESKLTGSGDGAHEGRRQFLHRHHHAGRRGADREGRSERGSGHERWYAARQQRNS